MSPSRRRPKQRLPPGGEEHHLAFHIDANLHAALVDCPVMPFTQETPVPQARLASVRPMLDMMRFGEP